MPRCCGGSSSSIKPAAERHDPSTDGSVAKALPHVRGGGLGEAYGFAEGSNYLARLLYVNTQVEERLFMELSVQARGIPSGFPQPDRLLSDDRIAL